MHLGFETRKAENETRPHAPDCRIRTVFVNGDSDGRSPSPSVRYRICLQAYAAVGWTGGGGGDSNDAGCVIQRRLDLAGCQRGPVGTRECGCDNGIWGQCCLDFRQPHARRRDRHRLRMVDLDRDDPDRRGAPASLDRSCLAARTGSLYDHTTTNFTLVCNGGAGGNFAGFSTRLLTRRSPRGRPILNMTSPSRMCLPMTCRSH